MQKFIYDKISFKSNGEKMDKKEIAEKVANSFSHRWYLHMKEAAKNTKIPVKELLALTPQNDPFYVGSKGDIVAGLWAFDIWQRMGSPKVVHIRRMHYWLVSQADRRKPNDEQYENTIKDWGYLMYASKCARYLELIPFSAFVDRRNPPTDIHAHYWEAESIDEMIELTTNSAIDKVVKSIAPFSPAQSQAYHLEIWCEKTTMNDIIMPLAQTYYTDIVTGMGELSITKVNELIEQRVSQIDKPTRIFYVSDFDPSGRQMPVSVARKIEYFSRHFKLPNVRLLPIVLLEEQCKEYKLPRVPIKEGDKRIEAWEEKYGEGATELDALEAIHPGELEKIVESWLDKFFDCSVNDDIIEATRDARKLCREKLDEEDLSNQILEILKTVEFDEIDVPEADVNEEADDETEWLLDTDLEYTNQMIKYARWKEGKLED